MTHTPTPWQRSGVRSGAVVGGVKTDGHQIGPDGDPMALVYYSDKTDALHRETLGNADFIVRAVNSHEILVKALAKFLATDEVMEGILWDSEPDTALVKITIPLGQYREARKALRSLTQSIG